MQTIALFEEKRQISTGVPSLKLLHYAHPETSKRGGHPERSVLQRSRKPALSEAEGDLHFRRLLRQLSCETRLLAG
jgi:hypothetical protein